MKYSNRGVLMFLALGLILVFAVLIFLLFSRNNPSETILPTIVAFNTLSPTEAENTENPEATASEDAIALSAASETVLPPTETISPSPSSTESATEAESTNTQAVVQASGTSTQSVMLQVSVTSQTNNPAPSSSPASSIVIVPSATSNVSAPQVPTHTQQSQAPVATLDQTGLVVFNQPIDIGGGDLRVLAMTAPADEVMLSLGESIPSIQANQQWVLVELFLVCEGTSNCTPPVSSFSLDSNRNTYAITPLTIESTFGSLLLGNQSLGHIAFVIPRNEVPFALELNKDGREYRFALQ
jgi:hypothetical protein